MASRLTDREWELLGRNDPYWAVVTSEAFRLQSMTGPDKLEAFLSTGSSYVDRLWQVLETHLGCPLAPRRALDFGCGVGRLVVPLARRCESVVGIDIARSMLDEAERLCAGQGLTNVSFLQGDDTLSGVAGTFDFVHSYIVLQHIPAERGVTLLRRLLDLLEPDGVAALHILYDNPDMARGWRRWFKTPLLHLANLFRRVPRMQMNAYPMDTVLTLLHDAGVRQSHLLFTDHGGCRGVIFLCRKTPGAACPA